MSRVFILLAAFVATAAISVSAAPTGDIFHSLLKEYKDLLPSELVETYKSLSDADKAVLKDVFKNIKNYKDEKELIAAIKEKSPELGAKAEKLYIALNKKVDGLSAEPQAFAKQLIQKARELHASYSSGEKIGLPQLQKLIEGQIAEYNKLSADAKTELKAAFPGVAKFLADDKVKGLVAKLLAKGKEN